MLQANSENLNQKILFMLFVLGITYISGLVISQVSFYLALALVIGLAIGIMSFISAEIALYMLIAAMLLSPEFLLGKLPGTNMNSYATRGLTLRFDDILIAVIGLGWLMKTAIRKELGLFLRTPLNGPIAYYILICFVTTIIGIKMGRVKGMTGIMFVMKYFEYTIIYFMAVNYLKEKRQIERFMWVLLIVCFLSCLIGLLQVTGDGRVFSPFESRGGEPNTFGGYLLLMLSMCLGLLITQGSIRYKTWIIALAILISITLAATLSRSSWLGLFPMLAVLLYLCKKKLIVIAPLVLILIVSPFVMPKSVKERALYTFTQKETEGQMKVGDVRFDTSTSARLTAWNDILTNDFKNHPLLGYGVTGYGFVDAQYPRVLVESGILGLISFLFLMVMMFKSGLRVFRQTKDPLFEGIALGYLIGMAGLLTHGIGANTFIIVRIMDPFWFITAMVIMMPSIESHELKTGRPEEPIPAKPLPGYSLLSNR